MATLKQAGHATPVQIWSPGDNPMVVNADGSINVSGTISASSAATATAANPSYSEGTSNALSQDLSGHLRVVGTINASTTAHANAAAPLYVEDTDDPLSQDLAGNLRVIAIGKGTAGTANSGVLTVQGIASMTPVQVSQATAGNLNATVVGTGTFVVQAAQSGTWNVGTVTTVTTLSTLTTVTNPVGVKGADGSAIVSASNPMPVNDAGGSLTVDGTVTAISGTAANLKAEVVGTGTFAVQIAANSAVNVAQINGVTPLMGAGNTGTGSLRVTIATDQTQLTNALKVDGSAVTQPVSGTVTANPSVSTPFLAAAISATTTTVVAGAGTLMSYYVYNPNSSVAYVQIFDISAAVTVGQATPKWSIGVPATSAANLSGLNLTFANAIKIAATTTATGSTGPATNLDANFGYR